MIRYLFGAPSPVEPGDSAYVSYSETTPRSANANHRRSSSAEKGLRAAIVAAQQAAQQRRHQTTPKPNISSRPLGRSLACPRAFSRSRVDPPCWPRAGNDVISSASQPGAAPELCFCWASAQRPARISVRCSRRSLHRQLPFDFEHLAVGPWQGRWAVAGASCSRSARHDAAETDGRRSMPVRGARRVGDRFRTRGHLRIPGEHLYGRRCSASGPRSRQCFDPVIGPRMRKSGATIRFQRRTKETTGADL